MEVLSECPVCGNQGFNPFISCKDYTVSNDVFNIDSCNSCGFKFTNPRPEERDLGKYYESDDYISHSNTNKGLINKIYQVARHYTLSKKLQLVSATARKKEASILDYGCGTGEFLNTCKTAKWKTKGVEPSDLGRKQAIENYGLEIYDDVFNPAFNGDKFDVITLWHVLEHVARLKPTMERLLSLLAEKGHIIIAVPNPASLDARLYAKQWAAYDVPRHLYHFTPDTINKLAEQFSLELVRMLPMTLDAFYVSMLSERYVGEEKGTQSALGLPKAFINGLRSNFNAAMHPGQSSSQIYVFKRV